MFFQFWADVRILTDSDKSAADVLRDAVTRLDDLVKKLSDLVAPGTLLTRGMCLQLSLDPVLL